MRAYNIGNYAIAHLLLELRRQERQKKEEANQNGTDIGSVVEDTGADNQSPKEVGAVRG
jgi:hypothetical protein